MESWCGWLLGTNRFLIRVCVRAVFHSMMPGPDHDHVLKWVGGVGVERWWEVVVGDQQFFFSSGCVLELFATVMPGPEMPMFSGGLVEWIAGAFW